ncbi:hypothetical protein BD769DRAFT_1387498 [Suillus cothurnatus]|nr:hypothetical protein BD769DRAFT_1387498 [Suillus cothurnatus]
MSEEASSVPTWSALAGCKWSATDWSCAYDITFMILFSMYCEATSQWSTSWSGENPIQCHLLSSFQTLLHPPTHHSSLRFDQERDSFRDLLSLYDPRKFPRTGSQLASVEAILEYVCRDNERMLQKVDMADQSGATRAEVLTFTLPTYCGPLHRNEQERTCLSLDIWLQMWFERQNAKLNHSPTPAIDTQVRVWRTLLCSPPSFLYFSLAVRQELVVEPSVTFTLPCGTGKAVYKLAGIVYFGGLHFTARLFTNEGELEYDSQTNDVKRDDRDMIPSLVANDGPIPLFPRYVIGVCECHVTYDFTTKVATFLRHNSSDNRARGSGTKFAWEKIGMRALCKTKRVPVQSFMYGSLSPSSVGVQDEADISDSDRETPSTAQNDPDSEAMAAQVRAPTELGYSTR